MSPTAERKRIFRNAVMLRRFLGTTLQGLQSLRKQNLREPRQTFRMKSHHVRLLLRALTRSAHNHDADQAAITDATIAIAHAIPRTLKPSETNSLTWCR